MTFKNPILSGMYPDPSICRNGEDYFLVTSSFEYFPALPVFHSRDLVHWQQIGHGIDRPQQMILDIQRPSSDNGTYAPTIRFHEGWFYLICTVVRSEGKSGHFSGNFVVKTRDPFAGWSEPIWIPEVDGIDPSLFFEDGKVYLTASRYRPLEGIDWHCEVYLQELDSSSFQPISEPQVLTDGAIKNATAAEAPHLYKRDEKYYLFIAEGGTAHNHAVTVFRADAITGPYQVCPQNPILTHRHLGQNFPIVGVGHADWVETQNGECWMVCLGMRPYGGYHYNLGRETFLVPMTWEDGWPVVSAGHGKVLPEYPKPNLPAAPFPDTSLDGTTQGGTVRVSTSPDSTWGFGETLGLEWNFLRTPTQAWWSLLEEPGSLAVQLLPAQLSEPCNVAFIARRQQHMNFRASVTLEFKPNLESHQENPECAGMVLFYSDEFHFRFIKTAHTLELIQRKAGQESSLAKVECPDSIVTLEISALGQEYQFAYGTSEDSDLLGKVDGRVLSAATAGGFVGTYVGMYASSNGQPSSSTAYFSGFEYYEDV
jgi:xylan 1,4-beta-xylosidase